MLKLSGMRGEELISSVYWQFGTHCTDKLLKLSHSLHFLGLHLHSTTQLPTWCSIGKHWVLAQAQHGAGYMAGFEYDMLQFCIFSLRMYGFVVKIVLVWALIVLYQ